MDQEKLRLYVRLYDKNYASDMRKVGWIIVCAMMVVCGVVGGMAVFQ